MKISAIPYHIHSFINFTRSQFLTPEQIKIEQGKKLQGAIAHAYKHVPYYKTLFDNNNVAPDFIKTIDDLKKIPISTRSDIQQVSKMDMTSDSADLDSCYNYKTGGSTGVPLNIYLSNSQMQRRHVMAEFMYFSNGFSFLDRTLRIFENKYDKPRNLFNKLGIMDRHFFVLDAPVDEIISKLLSWKPHLLISYPSTILELAQNFKQKGKAVRFLKGIFTSGEVLSDKTKGFIEDVFQTQVYDYYSANECGMIGWQCKARKGYHININDLIVEVVDHNGDYTSDEGRVIVTTLGLDTMPFIRYDLGDIAKLSQQDCLCGSRTPMIEQISGRALEFINIAGEVINPWYFTNTIEAYPGISKYQIVQNSDKHLEIKIVKNEQFKPDIAKSMIDSCSELVQHRLSVRVEIVSNLPETREDKYITVKNGSIKVKG